jgi:hypothetical protein
MVEEVNVSKTVAERTKQLAEMRDLADGIAQIGHDDTHGDIFYRQKTDGSVDAYLNLATGTAVRRDNYTTTTWENDETQWEKGVPTDSQAQIRKAVKYYIKDPLVNKCVSLLAQLANDHFRISAEDKNTEEFFKQWWKDISGSEFIGWFFKEYFRSGNVAIFKTLIPYRPKKKVANQFSIDLSNASIEIERAYSDAFEELSKGKWHYKRDHISRQKLTHLELDFAAKKYMWSRRMIPAAYTVLNPLTINVDGPKELPWGRRIQLNIPDDVAKIIKDPPKEVAHIVKLIPKEIVSEVKKGESKVYLPEHLASFVTRDKQPYEKWAVPLTTHAFEALDYKYELRTMDRATVRSVRDRILKVTIGNDEYPVFDDTKIRKLANEFNNPSRTLTLFWNHTLNIEYIEPDLDSLNIEKYEPPNEDIRACFGIAKNLTGNTGESLGNNVLNLKGLVEILDEAQQAFVTWFYQESKRIVEALGLAEIPESGFGKLNLKDENEFIKVLTQLVDRQIISYQTAQETLGYYFPREVDRLKAEQKLRESEGIFIPQQAPTQTSISGQEGRPTGQPKEGNRPSRKNKTQSPNGLKMVASIDPIELYDVTNAVKEQFVSLRSENSTVAKEQNDVDLWYALFKTIASSYGITETYESFIDVLVEAKHLQKVHDINLNEILPSVISKHVLTQEMSDG